LADKDGADFIEGKWLSSELIAEETAFVIRNAMVFDNITNTYCIVRLGAIPCTVY
jgi:hypothetical protein